MGDGRRAEGDGGGGSGSKRWRRTRRGLISRIAAVPRKSTQNPSPATVLNPPLESSTREGRDESADARRDRSIAVTWRGMTSLRRARRARPRHSRSLSLLCSVADTVGTRLLCARLCALDSLALAAAFQRPPARLLRVSLVRERFPWPATLLLPCTRFSFLSTA